jgi:hypothetical protein
MPAVEAALKASVRSPASAPAVEKLLKLMDIM